MTTEVWFRNPDNYIRELAEERVDKIVWDRGLLAKRRVDPVIHAGLHLGNAPWRILLTGQQGTAELDAQHHLGNPKAVYPTWEYGDPEVLLEELLANPVGEDQEACEPGNAPPDETPVFGQEHRIVIVGLPSANTAAGKRILAHLKELQEDYPQAIIHLHGTYSFRAAFGLGFASADFNPREDAGHGTIFLPSGKKCKWEHIKKEPQWATAMGMQPVDLEIPRNRCIFSIRAAKWAGENFHILYKLPKRQPKGTHADLTTPKGSYTPPQGRYIAAKMAGQTGDKVICDTCTLNKTCSYAREGAVCSVPGSEPKELAEYFGTRDSESIVRGLNKVLQLQADRLQQGLAEEAVDGLDPEVTKIANGLFDRGVALAKLVDPTLRDPKLAIQINNGPAAVTAAESNTRQMMGAVVRQLERDGIAREDITTEMIQAALTRAARPEPKVIEAVAPDPVPANPDNAF